MWVKMSEIFFLGQVKIARKSLDQSERCQKLNQKYVKMSEEIFLGEREYFLRKMSENDLAKEQKCQKRTKKVQKCQIFFKKCQKF